MSLSNWVWRPWLQLIFIAPCPVILVTLVQPSLMKTLKVERPKHGLERTCWMFPQFTSTNVQRLFMLFVILLLSIVISVAFYWILYNFFCCLNNIKVPLHCTVCAAEWPCSTVCCNLGWNTHSFSAWLINKLQINYKMTGGLLFETSISVHHRQTWE